MAAAVVVGVCRIRRCRSGRGANRSTGGNRHEGEHVKGVDHGRDHPARCWPSTAGWRGPDSIDENTDLFDAGMTSHASVNVMLALEDAFDFEFPETMLKKSTFESIAAIRAGVLEVTAG